MANHPRPVVTTAPAAPSPPPGCSTSSEFLMPPSPTSDGELLRSLHRLARDLSAAAETPAPFLRAALASISRRSKLLAAAFDDLAMAAGEDDLLPRSASLCLREILLVLQRFKAVAAGCAARSRVRLLLQSDEVEEEVRELHHDLATLLDLLPVAELGLADDVADLLALASRQCRRFAPEATAERALKARVLALIQEIEREIVPERERLAQILGEVGVDDAASCGDEIDRLERDIGDRVSERWTPAMIALVGLLRYAKCVLFSATPRPTASGSSSRPGDDTEVDDDDGEPPAPPPDFRCPISLDLMRDPVVVASGQTYDRESIARWFDAGKSTCPKTGQVLANLELVPNKSLKNLVAKWCRENGVASTDGSETGKSGEPLFHSAAANNKAAQEAARMTASFLVKKLSAVSSFSPDAASRVVHEIRLLSKLGSDSRAFLGEAGAVSLLVPLLHSDDAALQLNAVTALLNLSILEANKKRVMHADGAVEALCHVMSCAGATWRAKENAAATVLSLASVHTYRRRLGRNPSILEKLVHLVRAGPTSTKKDALAALLALAGERENIGRLVDAGVAQAALSAVGEEETASAVLAALAKRGGAEAIVNVDGAVARLVAEMRRGTEWGRENAAAALVLLCRRLGAQAVTRVMAVAGVEWAIWELMGTGTDRARRKAASLGRICRRWAAADGERGNGCPAASVVPPAMMAS